MDSFIFLCTESCIFLYIQQKSCMYLCIESVYRELMQCIPAAQFQRPSVCRSCMNACVSWHSLHTASVASKMQACTPQTDEKNLKWWWRPSMVGCSSTTPRRESCMATARHSVSTWQCWEIFWGDAPSSSAPYSCPAPPRHDPAAARNS